MSKFLLPGLVLIACSFTVAGQHNKHRRRTVIVATPPPQIFRYVQQAAVFPGDVNEWIHQHIRYPDQARESDWTGTVQILFEIARDGSVHVMSINKSSGHSTLDNEARRVIEAMPPWKPAKINGQAIPYLLSIPVIFKLTK